MLIRNPNKRRITAWLLVAALAFNLLWPTLARAQSAAKGVPMVLCTASGFQTIVAPADGNTLPAKHAGKTHCPLCLNPADHIGLPVHMAPPVWHTALLLIAVSVPPAAPHTVPAHTLAQPRAPPGIFS